MKTIKNITIGVDLDDTLNNLMEVWIEKYNQSYNDNLNLENIKSWGVQRYVKCGDKIYDFLKVPGFYYNLDLKDEYTYEGFQYLCENFDVYIISACDPQTVGDKARWIEKHFPFFDVDNKFISCVAKHLFNVDFLIDDGPHNIENFPNKTICVDAPYNRNVPSEKVDYRVKNWQDIMRIFAEMSVTAV